MMEGRRHGSHPLTAAQCRGPPKGVNRPPCHPSLKAVVWRAHTKTQRHTPTMNRRPKSLQQPNVESRLNSRDNAFKSFTIKGECISLAVSLTFMP